MIDHLERILNARSIEELWALHKAEMAKYGFDRLIYGYTQYRTENSFGDEQDLLILTNFPDDYKDGFLKDGRFSNGPMLQWALQNEGAMSWRWMEEQARLGRFSHKQLQVMEFNHAHGVTAGYTISFPSTSSRAKGAIGLTAKPGLTQDDVDAMWKIKGREILAFNNVAHLKIVNLPNSRTRRELTDRQREVLEWVGDGKTTQDIATILGLKQATIEKHLKLAREALDVDTTAQAVLKASFQNQIFLLKT